MFTALLLASLTTPTPHGPPACLTADSLLPAAGAGASVVLEAVYGHCEGASEFRVVQLWVGDEVAADADRLNLGYEAGMFFLEDGGSCAPMDPVVLPAQFGSLDCAASTVTIAGNQATVRWALEFDTVEFAGTHGVFFDAKGGVGDPEPRLGWTQMGTFLVQPGGGGESSSSGGGTTSGGSGSGSSSGGEDTKAGGTSSAGTTAAATDTEGSIPASGPGSRRGVDGCACTIDAGAGAWSWLVLFAAMRRRRRTR